MAGPLLIADVPWLLYRSYFALPKSITGAGGRPVNALLGTVNAILALIEAGDPPIRAVAACMGAEEAAYRVELYPPYHAHREPMPPELAEQWALAPALLESLGWVVPTSADLEADDVMFSYSLAESAAGGSSLHSERRPRHVRRRLPSVCVVQLRGSDPPTLIGPEQVRRALRRPAGAGARPDRAARRPLGRDPGGARRRREDGRRAAGRARLPGGRARGGGRARRRARGGDDAPRIAASISENEELLRAFKQIATLQTVEVRAPDDRASDFAAGARRGRRARDGAAGRAP